MYLSMHHNIIHIGKHICQNIYDHRIPSEQWACMRNYVENELHVPVTERDVCYKRYHKDSLVYEFTLPSLQLVCFSETIDTIDFTESCAFKYHRTRTIHDLDFQPINTYYNVHEITRTTYKMDDVSIIFEHSKNMDEIIVTYTRPPTGQPPTGQPPTICDKILQKYHSIRLTPTCI